MNTKRLLIGKDVLQPSALHFPGIFLASINKFLSVCYCVHYEKGTRKMAMNNRTALLARSGYGLAVPLMLAIVGLSGCATTVREATPPSPTQRALIGKTKQELKACALVKPEESVTGDLTILRYYKEASILEESFSGSKSSVPRIHHGCWATLGLKNDRVEGVRYDSVPSSYEDEDHCDEIFRNCLAS